MSSNYPPGTGPNDPRAPWNAKDPVIEDCEYCGGSGSVSVTCCEEFPACLCSEPEEQLQCANCEGEGKVEVEEDEEPQWEDE